MLRRPKFAEALTLARETGNKQSEASNQIHLAELLYLQGDLPGTTRALQSADSLLQDSGDKRHHLYALYSWEICSPPRMTCRERGRRSRRRWILRIRLEQKISS